MISYAKNRLLIGLGYNGSKIVQEVKRHYTADKNRPHVPYEAIIWMPEMAFLCVDENPIEVLIGKGGKEGDITPSEYVRLSDNEEAITYAYTHDCGPASMVLKNMAADCPWFSTAKTRGTAILNRRLARMRLVVTANNVVNALKQQVLACQQSSGSAGSIQFTLVADLNDGVATGIIPDIVTMIEKYWPGSLIDIVAIQPDTEAPITDHREERRRASAYATLRELNSLNIYRTISTNIEGLPPMPPPPSITTPRFQLWLFDQQDATGRKLHLNNELIPLLAEMLYMPQGLQEHMNTHSEKMMRTAQQLHVTPAAVEHDPRMLPNGSYAAARTRACGTIGMKRIEYPHEKIWQRLSAKTLRQVLLQMEYNNYRDGAYVDEAITYDADTLAADIKRYQEHEFCDNMLTLQYDHETDEECNYEDLWFTELQEFAEQVKEEKDSLPMLEKLTQDFYQTGFLSVGVEAYFAKAPNEIKDKAYQLTDLLLANMQEQWAGNDVSLNQLQQQLQALCQWLDTKRDSCQQTITNNEAELEAMEKTIDDYRKEWNGLSSFSLFGSSKKQAWLERHRQMLTNYYTLKTMNHAWHYALAFMEQIRRRLNKEECNIQGYILELCELANKQLDNLYEGAPEGTLPDVHSPIINLGYEPAIVDLERAIFANQQQMRFIAYHMHKECKHGWREMIELVRRGEFNDFIHKIVDQTITIAEDLSYPNCFDGDLYQSLLWRVGEEEAANYLCEAIVNTPTFLPINQEERNRIILHQDQYVIDNELRMVVLPRIDNPGTSHMGTLVENKLRQFGLINITHSDQQHVLTSINMHTVFPIRFAASLSQLKQEHDKLLADSYSRNEYLSMIYTEPRYYHQLASLEVEGS